MTPHQDLHWDEPDSGCISCGKPHITIADHRCADCLDELANHCPHCLTNIRHIYDRETIRRHQNTRADVHTEWTQRDTHTWITRRQQILEHRQRKP